MRPAHHGRLQRQVEFLLQQFLQDAGLLFTAVLTAECISRVLQEIQLCWNECVYTPLVTLWVFLGQVLSPINPAPRGSANDRTLCRERPQSVQRGNRCLLPGEEMHARALLLSRRFLGRTKLGRAGRFPVALERPSRLPLRWLSGLHARYGGEPERVPSDVQSEAGRSVV